MRCRLGCDAGAERSCPLPAPGCDGSRSNVLRLHRRLPPSYPGDRSAIPNSCCSSANPLPMARALHREPWHYSPVDVRVLEWMEGILAEEIETEQLVSLPGPARVQNLGQPIVYCHEGQTGTDGDWSQLLRDGVECMSISDAAIFIRQTQRNGCGYFIFCDSVLKWKSRNAHSETAFPFKGFPGNEKKKKKRKKHHFALARRTGRAIADVTLPLPTRPPTKQHEGFCI